MTGYAMKAFLCSFWDQMDDGPHSERGPFRLAWIFCEEKRMKTLKYFSLCSFWTI